MAIMCEADTQWIHPKTKEYVPCYERARVCIDGVNLCLVHAGRVAVRKLISVGLAEAIKFESQYHCTYKQ